MSIEGVTKNPNRLMRYNYPAKGYIFDLIQRKFAFYTNDNLTDDELKIRFICETLFLPQTIKKLDWKAEERLLDLY